MTAELSTDLVFRLRHRRPNRTSLAKRHHEEIEPELPIANDNPQ